MDLRFPKFRHLRSPSEFRTVYDYRCNASDAWLGVSAKPNELRFSRVGMSVSKRYGNAVRRNRLRRLYREAFRLLQHDLPAGIDFILMPRSPKEPTLEQVKMSLGTLAIQIAKRLAKGK